MIVVIFITIYATVYSYGRVKLGDNFIDLCLKAERRQFSLITSITVR